MQARVHILAGLLLVLAPATRALAHDPGLSELTLRQFGERVEFSVVVNHADLPEDRQATASQCSAKGVLDVRLDGRSVPIDGHCRLQDAQHTAFEGAFSAPRAASLAVQLAWFDDLPRGHRCFARLLDAHAAPVARALLARGAEPLRARLVSPGASDFATLLGIAAAVGFFGFAQRVFSRSVRRLTRG